MKRAVGLCVILCIMLMGCQKTLTSFPYEDEMNDITKGKNHLTDTDDVKYYKPKDNVINFMEDYQADKNIVLVDAKIIGSVGIGGSTDYNTDRTKCVYTESSGDLFYITKEEIKKIGTKTSKDPFDAVISSDGSGVLYTVNSELFFYDADNDNIQSIADAVAPSAFCISPDGNTIAYVSDAYEMYTYTNGEYNFYSYIARPIAVSNSGKQIITKDNQYHEIYIINEMSLNSHIIPTVSWGSDCWMGWGDSIPQVLFSTEGHSWICLDGVNLIELSNFMNLPSLLLPEHTVSNEIADFTKKLYYTDREVIYVDEQGNDKTVISDCKNMILTKDGSYIYYFCDDILFQAKVDDITDEKEKIEPKIISRGISASSSGSLYVNSDNNSIYYVDYNHDLFQVAGERWNLLSEKILSSTMTYDGVLYYISNENILYMCSDGINITPIAENVYHVESCGNDVYYWADEKNIGSGFKVNAYSVYGSDNGGSFKLIHESLRHGKS